MAPRTPVVLRDPPPLTPREAYIRGVPLASDERPASVHETSAERLPDVSKTSTKRLRDVSKTPGASIISERKRGPARARMTVYLSADARAALVAYCTRTGEEYSDVLEQALQGYLAKRSSK